MGNAGIGYLTPVSLYGIPVLGQVVSSINESIHRIRSSLSDFRNTISVPLPAGMKAGVGCGIALGYGYGAGVMVNESVALSAGKNLVGKLSPFLDRIPINTGKNVNQRLTPVDKSVTISSTSAKKGKKYDDIDAKIDKIQEAVSGLEESLAEITQEIKALNKLMQAKP